MACLVPMQCAQHALLCRFLPSRLSLCETSARSECPPLENDGPKTFTTGYIPLMDVYDKDVIHIYPHTNAHATTYARALTNMYGHTCSRQSEWHSNGDNSLSWFFQTSWRARLHHPGLCGFIIGCLSLCSIAKEDGHIWGIKFTQKGQRKSTSCQVSTFWF